MSSITGRKKTALVCVYEQRVDTHCVYKYNNVTVKKNVGCVRVDVLSLPPCSQLHK